MTRTFILAASAVAATLVAAAPADAQRWNANWRTIAFSTVGGRDTDIIRVPRHRALLARCGFASSAARSRCAMSTSASATAATRTSGPAR